jgi:pre-rRNA-processing protein IPI3
MMKPPDLSGHVSIDFKVGASADLKDTIPVKPVVPFQRTRDTKAREAHEVLVLLKNKTAVRGPLSPSPLCAYLTNNQIPG